MSTTQGFALPDGVRPVQLRTAILEQSTLLPNSPVLCINRGRTVLKDTYDGIHVEIQPGYFETEYGAAQHFQRRLIVPGTRNLERGGYQSFIGILGSSDGRVRVDAEELCQPFTEDELLEMGQKIEAFERSEDDKLTVKRVSGSMAGRTAMLGAHTGTARGTQISADRQATPAAEERAAEVFAPPTSSDTREAEAEAGRTPRGRSR